MPGGGDKLALKLQSGPVVPPGPGFHLAFDAPSHAAVDRFHADGAARPAAATKARRARAHTMGATYYAAFVRDPDGHKLEAVFQ